MTDKILILDFGSQYTQLIARVVREANVFCEIIPFNKTIEFDDTIIGVILSGSPCSVNEIDAPEVDVAAISEKVPVLGICYGALLTAKTFGGIVAKSNKREYGRANLEIIQQTLITEGIENNSHVWMSHSDTVQSLPKGFKIIGKTDNIAIAAFENESASQNKIIGLQFHPEVYHSAEGKKIIENFLVKICGCKKDWTAAHFITETVAKLKEQLGNSKVVMGLSGGVDSTVAATLLHKAIGENLYGIFVNNGVLRKDEFEEVLEIYKELGLNVKGVDASKLFYDNLAGKTDPEEKRKAIGGSFIEVFDEEAKKTYEQILGNLKLIKVGAVIIKDAQINAVHFENRFRQFDVNKINIQLSDVLVDSAHSEDTSRILFCKNASFKVDEFQSYNRNRPELTVNNVSFVGIQKRLTFSKLISRF